MKEKLIIAFFCSLLFLNYSCGGSSDNKDSEDESTKSEKGILESITDAAGTVKHMSKMEQYAKEMEKRMNDLKSLTPVTNDVIKSVFPEQIDGLKRISYDVGELSAMNVASGKASFEAADSEKNLSLEIMDGAGEAASAMASILFLAFQTDKDSENQSGFEKTIDLDGNRALIKERDNNGVKNSEIQWLLKERFIITLKGNGYSYEELANIQKSIDLSNLE